jgi:MerR family transcriptional regulator, copper efflux regulator
MPGLRVSELARRAGLTPSAVRFYERGGLLSPARRSANGYREFDESAVDQLTLVARAKSIGMSLEDIGALTAAWPGGECRSVQARIRGFAAARVTQVREQRAALRALERRLLAALGKLPEQDPGPARCAPGCGCDTALGADPSAAPPGAGAAAPGTVSSHPGAAPSHPGTIPAAGLGRGPWGCTLDRDALVSRLGEWRALAAAATSAEPAGDGVRLVLPPEPDLVAAAARLCAAETACCDQTRFLLEVTAGQVTLTARAPGAPGLVEAMMLA